MKHLQSVVLIMAVALAVIATTAMASGRASATLSLSPNSGAWNDSYTVSGCGYDASRGRLSLSFAQQADSQWDDALVIDTNGCINTTIKPFRFNPPGTYDVRITQSSGKGGSGAPKIVAETTVTFS